MLSKETLKWLISFSGVGRSDHNRYFKKETTQAVISALRAFTGFEVEVEQEHYGSGIASYRAIYCARRLDFSAQLAPDEVEREFEFDSICLYLCELLPVATWSALKRNKGYERPHGSTSDPKLVKWGGGFLSPYGLLSPPPGDWSDVVKAIHSTLDASGVSVLGSDVLSKPLPFAAEIATLLPIIECRWDNLVFDAVFFWMD